MAYAIVLEPFTLWPYFCNKVIDWPNCKGILPESHNLSKCSKNIFCFCFCVCFILHVLCNKEHSVRAYLDTIQSNWICGLIMHVNINTILRTCYLFEITMVSEDLITFLFQWKSSCYWKAWMVFPFPTDLIEKIVSEIELFNLSWYPKGLGHKMA